MSRYLKKAVYDPATGEVFHLWTYPDDETAELHFLRSGAAKRGWVMADITDEEYSALQELGEDSKLARAIDTGKIRAKLREREKEEFEVHEHGVTYRDLRPAGAVRKK